jgi:hypothetical protein
VVVDELFVLRDRLLVLVGKNCCWFFLPCGDVEPTTDAHNFLQQQQKLDLTKSSTPVVLQSKSNLKNRTLSDASIYPLTSANRTIIDVEDRVMLTMFCF